MLSPESLQVFRCPLDPARQARLTAAEDHVLCERCGLRYKVRDGLPVLIVEEAELPEGVARLRDLPCQHQAAPETSPKPQEAP
jgi:uncharacterized protein YbaR (Trm112 family)